MDNEPVTADHIQQMAADLHAQGDTQGAAVLWGNLSRIALKQNRPLDAAQCAREALGLDPANPDWHNNLGIAMHGMNALAEAENHFRGALRLHPGHGNACLNLGVIRHTMGQPAEAEALYRQARAFGVNNARTGNNLALALAGQGRLDEAETAARDALLDDPGYAEAEVNLAMILLMRGDPRGWRHYEARWRIAPLNALNPFPDAIRWTGAEPVAGKTILLHAEQGFGDTIQFCRYAPLVTALGARTLLAVPPDLLRLMRSVRDVGDVVTLDAVPAFDLHCPLLSLPLILGTPQWRAPYLAAEAATPAHGRRIGLVWAGGGRPDQAQAAAIDKRRSMKLADMARLGDVPDCAFVSLQLGPPAKQPPPFPLIDGTAGLSDFADTAALIETLDLVIAVDTAVAHLAGALGKPVWLLSRFDGCWRWGAAGETTPWYPTMRIFRQTEPGDWAGVIGRVAAALREFRTIG